MEENKRTAKSIMDTTSNKSVYAKARKRYLEYSGKLKCSICSYHCGCNDNSKYYGSVKFWGDATIKKVRIPSWKLATKNRKQWMKKPINYQVLKKTSLFWGEYIDIKF